MFFTSQFQIQAIGLENDIDCSAFSLNYDTYGKWISSLKHFIIRTGMCKADIEEMLINLNELT